MDISEVFLQGDREVVNDMNTITSKHKKSANCLHYFLGKLYKNGVLSVRIWKTHVIDGYP